VKDGVVVVLGKNLPVGPNCEVIDADGGYITVRTAPNVLADLG
jgi:hypothetical protein